MQITTYFANRWWLASCILILGSCGSNPEQPAARLAEANANNAVQDKPAARAAESSGSRNRVSSRATSERQFPRYVTAYDVLTKEDEFYYHYLSPLCVGAETANWPLVRDLVALGQGLYDANALAHLINDTIYVSDQPRARPIVEMVEECAAILGVQVPALHIEQGPLNAYVTRLKPPHHLVVTSELLEKFQDDPDQLRFVIGHELGHIKAGHLRTHLVAELFRQHLLGEPGSHATFNRNFVAEASIGAMLHWYRESEFSADRAGLLCVGGDLRVAQQALLRLNHGIQGTNKLFDPAHPDFDPEKILAAKMQFERQPFVRILSFYQGLSGDHPFIPERCAALKLWALSAHYATIMERSNARPTDMEFTISSIDVHNIPAVDYRVWGVDHPASDPFVRVTYNGETQETGYFADACNATWKDVGFAFPYAEGASVVVEVFDYNLTLRNTFIGSCVLPVAADEENEGSGQGYLRFDVMRDSTRVETTPVTLKYRVQKQKRS